MPFCRWNEKYRGLKWNNADFAFFIALQGCFFNKVAIPVEVTNNRQKRRESIGISGCRYRIALRVWFEPIDMPHIIFIRQVKYRAETNIHLVIPKHGRQMLQSLIFLDSGTVNRWLFLYIFQRELRSPY